MNAGRPFTYAYRYSDGLIYYGTGGRSINGGQPTEAIALYSAEQMNRAVQEALATPPTSEWNEAIEAAAKECEEHSAVNLSGWGNECAILVRALKRKERT